MLLETIRGVRRLLGALTALLLVIGFAQAGPMSGFVGHTSPQSRDLPSENFSRPDKDGKIRPVSIVAADRLAMPTQLSGTVYYVVYELDNRDPNDPWGTGIPNFVQRFRAGIDFNGGASPDIDSRAKYLYLYQVVNDQRTLPPIESMSTKLLVELSEITSWGYFDGLGFATKDGDAIRPVSATHKVDRRTYLSPAPALPIAQPLVLTTVPTTRGEIAPKRDPSKIVQVQWDALDPATPPDYVMILGSSDFDRHPSFRSIWTGKNAIGKDGRSTAFGFTSPMPPTIEPVRLRTSREATKEAGLAEDEKAKDVPVKNKATEAVKQARLAEDEAAAPGKIALAGIEGRVPTPFPTSAGLAFNPDRDKATGTGGGGFPMMSSPPAAPSSIGGAGGGGGFVPNTFPPSSGGGFGTGGAFSTGGGGVFVTTTAPAQGTATAAASATVTVNNNFSISQFQQQAQSQFQFQSQSQSQKSRNGRGGHGHGGHDGHGNGGNGGNGGGGGHGGNVVPEPASIVGLGLGLPALWFAYRRRRSQAVRV